MLGKPQGVRLRRGELELGIEGFEEDEVERAALDVGDDAGEVGREGRGGDAVEEGEEGDDEVGFIAGPAGEAVVFGVEDVDGEERAGELAEGVEGGSDELARYSISEAREVSQKALRARVIMKGRVAGEEDGVEGFPYIGFSLTV